VVARKKPRRYRAVRRILIATALIVTTFVGATLATIFHDGTLAVVLRVAARQVAGVKVDFRGPVSFQWQPSMRLVAGNVWIAAQNEKEWSGVIRHVALTLENFQPSGNRLFLTNLAIGAAEFKVQPAAWVVSHVSSSPRAMGISKTLAMIKSLDIEDVDILILGPGSELVRRVHIDEIQLDDGANGGPLRLRGRGGTDGRRGTLDGKLGSIDLVTAGQPYPVDVKLSLPSLELIVAGTIDDPVSGRGMNLALDLDVPDTGRLDVLFGGAGDVHTALTATSRLTGDVGSTELKNIQLSAVGSGLDLLVSGSITNPRNLTGLALDITATLSEGTVLSSLIDLPADVPFQKIAGKTRLTDDDGSLLFDQIELITRSDRGVRLTGRGDAQLRGPIDALTLAALNLDLAVQAPSLAAFGPVVPAEFSELRDIVGSARLTGQGQSFALKAIDIRAGGDGPVTAHLTSTVPDLTALFKNRWPIARLTIEARDSQDLAKLAGRALPSLGLVKAAADLRIDDDAVDLTNLRIGIGSSAEMRIDANGTVKGIGGDTNRPYSSMDLHLKTAGRTLDWLKPYLPARTIVTVADALTRVNGTARMTGNGATLGFTDIDLQAHFGDTAKASVSGRIDAVRPSLSPPFGDLSLTVNVTAPDARPLGQLLQIDVPDVGRVALTTTVRTRDRTDIVDLDRMRLNLDQVDLVLIGSLANLAADQVPRLVGNITFSPDKLIALAGGPAASGLGPARASIDVEFADKQVVIHQAAISSIDYPAMTAATTGNIATITPFRHAVTLTLAAPPDTAPGLQDAMDYFPQGGMFFDGTLTGDAQATKLKGAWRSGGSEAQLDVDLSKASQRPRVAGGLKIAVLDIADIENAFTREATEPESTEPAPTADGGPIFSETALPFHWIDQVDVELDVGISEIKGRRLSVKNVAGQVRLVDRQFELVDFVSQHADGEFRFSGLIDARTDRPALHLTATGDDLDLKALLWQVNEENHAEGSLTLDIDLTATGSSPRQLAESLNGHFGAALEDGRFHGSNLDLLSTKTFQWLRAAARPGKTTTLRCIIARMAFEQGIGTTESLLLITPKMKISGTGRINLHKEEMDITLAADRKTIAIVPAIGEPLRIHGPLSDPKFDADVTGHVTDLGVATGKTVMMGAGSIAAPMIFIPLGAAGYLVSLLSEPDSESACLAEKATPTPAN